MKKLIKLLLFAFVGVFICNQASAQAGRDTNHYSRARLQTIWASTARQVPDNPGDSCTWASVWNFVTDGYPINVYTYAKQTLGGMTILTDTAKVGAAGTAQISMKTSTGVHIYNTAIYSVIATVENDTVSQYQNVPYAVITTNNDTVIKVLVANSAGLAPAGTLVHFTVYGK